MTVLAMSLQDGSMPTKKAGQGEVGGFIRRVKTSWPCLGLDIENPQLVGTGWAVSLLLCTNWVRKLILSLVLVGPLFLAYSQSEQVVVGQEH